MAKASMKMSDEIEDFNEIYLQDNVIIKSSILDSNNVDSLNTLGVLAVVDHKSDLGKCIEWNQCDVSIESDDQEWAIVRDSKSDVENGIENSKSLRNPLVRIPLKNIVSFKISKSNSLLSLHQTGKAEPIKFYFQSGQVKNFVDFLKRHLNTSVCKRDLNLYIVRDQKEVQVLEKSFAELDLFSDDNTRSDALWSFMKKLHDHPYETTLSAFSKVTDVFLFKPQQREMDSVVAELLTKSLTSEEMGDFHRGHCPEDYELISKGPPLPPRTLPPRGAPFTDDHWALYSDCDGRVTDSDKVKHIIFHGGIHKENKLRTLIWKFLLGYYSWDSTFKDRETMKKKKKEQYLMMKLQWKCVTPVQEENFSAFKERKNLIEKDVFRTDRNMPFYAGENNSNLDLLKNILMTYVMYNFDLGYVQGMSDLLAPLLYQLQDESDTFWCFVGFMSKVYRNFDMDQAGMKEQLSQLYQILCCLEPELASYLKHQDSKNMSFCFRWLLIWFKREFSYEDILTLWEVLWSESLCKNFHLLICAAILDTEKEKLMSNNYGFTEILKHINELANQMDLELILRKAEGMFYQLSNAANVPEAIREILGLEPLQNENVTETGIDPLDNLKDDYLHEKEKSNENSSADQI